MKKIKKFAFDKKYVKISGYALAIIILALIANRVISNVEVISGNIMIFFNGIKSVLATMVYGFFIAYFLNSPTRFLEGKGFGRINRLSGRPRLVRVLSILSVYIMLIGLLYWLLTFVFPEIVSSFQRLITALRTAVDSFYGMGIRDLADNEALTGVLKAFNDIFYTDYSVRDITDQLVAPVLNVLNSVPGFMGQIYNNLVRALTNLLNFVLGIIIASYMLYEKDNVKALITRVLYAFFRKETADGFIEFARRSNKTLEGFTVGKLLDSAIMGVLFFLTCILLRLPFPLLLSIIFGITNIIPYFGPIVGGVIVSIIVFIQNPIQGLWTAVASLILQQIDGNVIGPKILGDSIGLKPLSVIFSILVGGALFGVPGMFFGAPVFSILMSVVTRFVNNRLAKRQPSLEILEPVHPVEEPAPAEEPAVTSPEGDKPKRTRKRRGS